MATHTKNIVNAEVSSDGADTVIRFSGEIPIASGPMSVRRGGVDGGITLTPVVGIEERQAAWIVFLEDLSNRPVDPDFMKERPMNRPPVEKNLFPDE